MPSSAATQHAVDAVGDTEELKRAEPHTQLLRLLWGVHRDGYDGATYAGVNHALGFVAEKHGHTSRGKMMCRRASDAGFVTLERTGWGRGAKTIVRLSDSAHVLCARLFGDTDAHTV